LMKTLGKREKRDMSTSSVWFGMIHSMSLCAQCTKFQNVDLRSHVEMGLLATSSL
jgi:hypothetical protein